REREGGIDPDGLLEERERLLEPFLRAPIPLESPLEIEVVRFRRSRDARRGRRPAAPSLEAAGEGGADLFLESEQGGERPPVSLAPDLGPVGDVDELGRDV